jgi:hypothetical protein
LEHLKIRYPDEYAELYADLLKKPPNALMRETPRLWKVQADRLACETLRDRHGIRK